MLLGSRIDFQEPYLKQLLGFIGITDVAFIHAERSGLDPEARERALTSAKEQIGKVVARIASGETEPSVPAAASASERSVDYDAIMPANLVRVFGERDPSRRIEAIRELYAADAALHEPERSVQGHGAISQAVTELLAHLPLDFVFSAIRPALGHNGLGGCNGSRPPIPGRRRSRASTYRRTRIACGARSAASLSAPASMRRRRDGRTSCCRAASTAYEVWR